MIWPVLVFSALIFVFGLAVYRAKTQPIAHDEALEYEWFLDASVSHVLNYNPANHVLFTLPPELLLRSTRTLFLHF